MKENFFFFFKFSPSPAGCRPSSPLILAGGHPFPDCLGCEEPGRRQPSQQPEPEETPPPTCPCWGKAKEFERRRAGWDAGRGWYLLFSRVSQKLTPPVQVWGGPLWAVSCGGDILTRSNICLSASSRRPPRDQKNDANIQREMGHRKNRPLFWDLTPLRRISALVMTEHQSVLLCDPRGKAAQLYQLLNR